MGDVAEDVEREQLAHRGPSMDDPGDSGGGPDQPDQPDQPDLPAYAGPEARLRPRWTTSVVVGGIAVAAVAALAALAALAVAGVGAGGTASDRAPEDADGLVVEQPAPAADQPALPGPEGETSEPPIAEPVREDELAVPGGEPTPAVRFVGEQVGAPLVEWVRKDDVSFWSATYQLREGAEPTNLAVFVTSDESPRRPRGQDAIDTYLPGAEAVELEGVDDAFFRGDEQAGIVTIVANGRVVSLSAGSDDGLDQEALVDLTAAILAGLPE